MAISPPLALKEITPIHIPSSHPGITMQSIVLEAKGHGARNRHGLLTSGRAPRVRNIDDLYGK